MSFEHLQGYRLHMLSGQPVPVLGHPDSKKVFPDIQFVPIASGPVSRYLAPSCLHPPFRYFGTL